MFRAHRVTGGQFREITLDCDFADFVDSGPGEESEGVATYTDLLPAGWYLHYWQGEVITPFAGGGAVDQRIMLGNTTGANLYTSTVAGLSCDTQGEVPGGHARVGSNNPQTRTWAASVIATVKVHGGDTDFSSLTAGKIRVTLYCQVQRGF